MLVLCVAAMLGLLSRGQSTPLTCENLVKPLEKIDLDMMKGNWIKLADSTPILQHFFLKMIYYDQFELDSRVEFTSNSTQNKVMSPHALTRYDRSCHSFEFGQITLVNNSRTQHNDIQKHIKSSVILLETDCPDCLIIQLQWNDTLRNTRFPGLQL